MTENEQRETARAALEHLERTQPHNHKAFIEKARTEGFDDPVAAMVEVAKLAGWAK